MALLRPEFGPGLPDLLAPRLRWTVRRTRIVLITAFAVLVAVQGFRILTSDTAGLTREVVVRSPVAFTLGYRPGFKRITPQGAELVRLQSRPSRAVAESFTVSSLLVAPYRGEPAGVLPVLAARDIAPLRARFPDGFRYRGDGRGRVGPLPAHQLLFQTRIAGRLVFGKRFWVLPDEPGARRGAIITILSQASRTTPSVSSVGGFGLARPTLRSFAFGAG